jgi:thioredoxin 1
MIPGNNQKENFNEIIRGNIPVLLDFTAAWCGPCKMMNPILEELHKRKGKKLRILKIDIDQSPAAANAFQIQSVPTLLLFHKGRQLWRQSGVMQTGSLEKIIDQFITHL